MIRTLSLRSIRSVATEQKAAIRLFSSSKQETYTERQAKKGRPVSPHVTIYKFPTAAISSIANRVTGVGLSVGALHLVGCDVPSLFTSIGDVAVLGHVAKFGVAFPLIYHYLGGIRHVLWDRNPDLLENDKVETASQILLGSATVITLGATFI